MASPDEAKKIEMQEARKPKGPRPKVTLKRIHYSDFNVHIVTWNVASFAPGTAEIESLFHPQEGFTLSDYGISDLYQNTDILVVGLQEAYQNVQDTFTSSLPLVGRDAHVEDFSYHLSVQHFVRLSFCRILGIVIMVFVKQPLLCYIHGVLTSNTRTGFGGWVGNKGAVSVCFTLGDLSVCFINCHLTAQRDKCDTRMAELKDILETQLFENGTKPLDHDVLVLLGDLNFRLEGKEFAEVVKILDDGGAKELLVLDQLWLEQKKGTSKLSFFMEMPLTFQPSYRYKIGTDTLSDGDKGRAPAWCDRVLWHAHERTFPKMTDLNPQSVVKDQYYCMHKQPRSSDHKAVSAGLTFSVDISKFSPPVIFHLSEWVCGVRGTIEFTVAKDTEISMWDWVGLFPYQFSNLDRDCLFWVLTPAQRGKTPQDCIYSRELKPDQLQFSPGKYVLLYKSFEYGRVLGMSPIFPIFTP